MTGKIPSLRTLLWRGCRKKCPQCGQGAIYRRWNTLRENCEVCGLRLLTDQGDLWGFLLLVDRALFILPLIVLIYFQLYNPGSIWFYVFAGALLLGLVVTLPHRNGLSLALDYLIRRKCGDLAEPQAIVKTKAPGDP